MIVARLFPLFVSVLRDVRRWIWWGAPAVRDAAFHQRRAQYLLDTVTLLPCSWSPDPDTIADQLTLFDAVTIHDMNTAEA